MANRKFVRALQINTPGSIATPYLCKLMYELWGYVLYGASTPTAPAAAAFPASNPNNFPANALEGTSVLATGTNGATINGSNQFTSAGATFTTAMIGSVLTMWVPGSGITDDGLYLITGVPNATTLQIQVANGGHPDPVTHQPVLTTRGSILYRVVNCSTLNALSWVTTDYIIFQMNPSASDNPNASQATSQVQIIMNGQGGTTGCNVIGSPAGTWTGAAFTDAMGAVTQQTNGGGFSNFTPTIYTMTADFDGFFTFFHGSGAGTPAMSNLIFEAPTRVGIYPSTTSDQNPLTYVTDGFTGIYISGGNSAQYSLNNFNMVGTDAVTRRHRMQVKNLTGDGTGATNNVQYNGIISQDGLNDIRLTYAFDRGSTFVSPILLGQTFTITNFTRCRAILKQLYSCSPLVPNLHRLGSNGQYLHWTNGLCMIWDNTIMPISLIPFGL
jgi:hypothetical protein